MIIGQHAGKIDEKSRIAFPRKFRLALNDRLLITRGFERSLIIVSEKSWQSLLQGTENKPFTQSNVRQIQRFLLGGATLLELDGKGRFILPDYLKQFAGIMSDVIFLGLANYVELWDKEKWEAYSETMNKTIAYVAENLTEREKNDRVS